MIVAIYGKSCTGKTIVAKKLAKEIKAKIRCCGEEVEKRAKELQFSVKELSREDHIILDRETRDLALSCTSYSILEGSFLPHVLHNITNVLWVELKCNDSIRAQRYSKRKKFAQEIVSITERDIYEESLRKALYRNRYRVFEPALRIDTSDKSIEEIVFLISSLMRGNNVDKA